MTKTKAKTKKETLSLDEEMLMWTSYRYCIGRKTYVNSLASYIGKKYYHLLNDNKAQHTAVDIRKCIADCLRFQTPAFDYDGTINYEDRNPIADYLSWLTDNVNSSKDLYNTKKISCYKKGYGDKYPKLFEVQISDKEWTHIYESDIENYLCWEDLASLFDRKHHINVTVEFNGETKVLECFEVWRHKYITCEDNSMYIRPVEWKWEKRYMSVENYLQSGEHAGTLNPEYIKRVENGEA